MKRFISLFLSAAIFSGLFAFTAAEESREEEFLAAAALIDIY